MLFYFDDFDIICIITKMIKNERGSLNVSSCGMFITLLSAVLEGLRAWT